MRAAIYARYSSDQQRAESIEDQVNSCMNYAIKNGYEVDSANIYTDYAISGSLHERNGLSRMEADSKTDTFSVILVDDLSRLTRGNAQLNQMIDEYSFDNIYLISVADNINTKNPDAKISYQLRGIVNEVYLDDLRKKTMRGQIGQLDRGFVIGLSTFGYYGFPVGVGPLDDHGHPKPQGIKAKINIVTSKIVERVFLDYSKGKSVNAIVADLNTEGVPTKSGHIGSWGIATIYYLLRNEKYIGKWCWGVMKVKRDPRSGKVRQELRTEGPLRTVWNEELRIISTELWEKVQARLKEVKKVWPGGKGKRGFKCQQGSEVKVFPKELLSGAMICSECGGTIGKASGSHGGYYGCIKAVLGGCNNKLIVRKKIVERAILDTISEKLNNTAMLQDILKRVEVLVAKLCKTLPDEISTKKHQLHEIESKVRNFVNFIADGDTSNSVREALLAYEKNMFSLKSEVLALEETTNNVFKAPPLEWIKEKVINIKETLELQTEQSALLLRNILGTIKLEPVTPDIGKPYLKAVSKLHVWALIEKKRPLEKWPSKPEPYDGSNSIDWRPLADALRTL